jgi:hypothetical protein
MREIRFHDRAARAVRGDGVVPVGARRVVDRS